MEAMERNLLMRSARGESDSLMATFDVPIWDMVRSGNIVLETSTNGMTLINFLPLSRWQRWTPNWKHPLVVSLKRRQTNQGNKTGNKRNGRH